VDGLGFYSWKGQEIFFFSEKSTLALTATHSRTELIPGVPSPEKRGQDVKLTIHVYPLPILRLSGVIPPLTL
jgi:hypothetical protein